ncbi:MAG: prepilin-type N-terminal cleavage/methylation domain-containing protein [Nitrospirae bacterium]|nr:prepilin-type N-terminal cleavage/methylation domain-containing protein [Nitrospirota bacterium]
MPRATNNRGFSLIEVLIVIGIFSVLMAAVSVTFSTQARHGSREYRVAESEVELGIVKNLLERDIVLAGYGLADDYGTTGFSPRGMQRQTGPNALILMGTALGLNDPAPLHWAYATAAAPTFRVWGDSREDLLTNDRVILLEPNTEQILTQGATTPWLFRYNSSSSLVDSGGTAWTSPTIGTLVYGVDPGATQPYATVTYSLTTTNLPSNCATGTSNLERTESWGGAAVTIPLLACTLSLQTAFGLDTNEDGTIDLWDNNAGAVASGYSQATLAKRLKQVRVYLLVQIGNRDASYTYPAATVRVGDTLLATGADVALDAEQRRFRWRLVSIDVTPRNVR